MDKQFKLAVRWAFHYEPDDLIRDELGYEGDLEEVHAYVKMLREKLYETDYDMEDEDFVYAWSNSDTIKFPWEKQQ